MEIRNKVESEYVKQTNGLSSCDPFQALETGSADAKAYDDFIANVCKTHLRSPQIHANVQAAAQVLALTPSDRILGILPFFHSFGYTATLWLAAMHGLSVVFYPSPLDSSAIGSLVQPYKVTFLIATPTFLQLYLRRCAPEQFGSLRAVLTGAEKLPERLADAFEEQFGIRPFEGYGTTECAPVNAHRSLRSILRPSVSPASINQGTVGDQLGSRCQESQSELWIHTPSSRARSVKQACCS